MKRKEFSGETIVCDVGKKSVKIGFATDNTPQTFSGDLESCLSQFLQKRDSREINLVCSGEEFVFKNLHFSKIHFQSAPSLIMAARGATTGLVVDVGESGTRITPIFEGYEQKTQAKTLEIGGAAVTRHLVALMEQTDDRNHCDDVVLANQLKEKYCYIAQNLEEEAHIGKISNLLTITEKKLILTDERYLAGEILFQPKLLRPGCSEWLGIGELLVEAVESCALDLRNALYKNVLLAGGGVKLPGFAARLRQECPLICVDQEPDSELLVFRGGCVVAQNFL